MIKDNNTVYFVGSGPGDPELITIKAQRLLENADVIVYSGSLLNPKLLENARQDASVHDAALIDREEIFNILKGMPLSRASLQFVSMMEILRFLAP